MPKKPHSEETVITKTYLVTRKGGRDQKITVPAFWKVTFGPLNPGAKHGDASTPALRFYETKDNQRAVITDVISFRDMDIKVEEKRTSVKAQTLTKSTPQGDKAVVVEGRVEEWVNPDAPQQDTNTEFFRLEHREETPDEPDEFGLR